MLRYRWRRPLLAWLHRRLGIPEAPAAGCFAFTARSPITITLIVNGQPQNFPLHSGDTLTLHADNWRDAEFTVTTYS